VTPEERLKLIAAYKDGHRAVADAVAGASDAELDARPAPGKWSSREIVHHLADSEMTAAVRLRKLLVETNPTIEGYDQDAFAARLTQGRPVHASLQALRYARETSAELLDRMSDEDWTRSGMHPEHGPYGMEKWLKIYAGHAHKHAEQIKHARAADKS
jgi:hypothetical protein